MPASDAFYGVISFQGDIDQHPDPDLQGQGPFLTLICRGDEQFCWEQLDVWTKAHPLRVGEVAEVLHRTSRTEKGQA